MARVGLDTQDWGQGGAGGGSRPPGTPRPRPKELGLCVPRRSPERDFVASRTSCPRVGACQTPQRPQVLVTAVTSVTGHDGIGLAGVMLPGRPGGAECDKVAAQADIASKQRYTNLLHIFTCSD